MINKLLNESTNFNSISDSKMKSIIKDFFLDYYTNDMSFLRRGNASKNPVTAYTLAIRFLSYVFRDIYSNELNSSTCISLLDKGAKNPRLYELFWVYICEQQLTHDNTLLRLTYFKEVFLRRDVNLKYLNIIFDDPLFDKHFIDSYYYENLATGLNEFSNYFFIPEYEFIKNSTLKNDLYSFMNELKYSKKLSPGSLRNWQLACNNAICTVFKKYSINSLNRKIIYKYAKECDQYFSRRIDYKKALIAILTFLQEKGYKLPDQIDILINIMNSKKAIKPDDWETLTLSDELDKWYLVHDKRPGREGGIIRTLYINYPIKEVRDAFHSFLEEYQHNELAIKNIALEFEKSFRPYSPSSLSELDYKTFNQQLTYFTKNTYQKNKYVQCIIHFYIYIWKNYNENIFKNDFIDPHVLIRSGISYELINDYTILNYNPAEDVPKEDKWILCYGENIRSNSMVKNGIFSYSVDFTTIQCPTYRKFAKQWFWNSDAELSGKISDLSVVSLSLNYIYNIKIGKELSVFSKKSNNLNITINDIVAWKNWIINNYSNNRTISHKIYSFRNYILFTSESGICNYESGVFYHLTYTLNQNYDNANALSNEELTNLARIMKDEAKNSLIGNLCYSVFYIALETEFRPSQIFALQKDCIRETAKKNEYVLVSRSKTSAGEYCEYPITEYVKREIDEVIKATDSIRNITNTTELKDYLFLIPRRVKGTVQILDAQKFNKHIKQCCIKAGIRQYTISNLRDTHMTKAEEEIIRKSLSDVQLRILTGHKNRNSDRSYIDHDIRSMLEAVHGIIIGDISLEGKIISSKNEIVKPENEVSHSCGYCNSKTCEDLSYLDCMLCKSFVTTIDRLPYFYEQLNHINSKIPLTKCPHDKEDLVNIKRLLLYYIEKILEAKGQ